MLDLTEKSKQHIRNCVVGMSAAKSLKDHQNIGGIYRTNASMLIVTKNGYIMISEYTKGKIPVEVQVEWTGPSSAYKYLCNINDLEFIDIPPT